MNTGYIFDIQHFSINNGPGIRTTVFLKGCPMRCIWCHNPESYQKTIQLRYMSKLCKHCSACVGSCKNKALDWDNGELKYDKSRCVRCGDCVRACSFGALTQWGRTMITEEIVDIVTPEKVFFDKSGGGVTISGGEPTYQSDFLFKLLEKLHEQGIHTTVDTNGYCSEQVFHRLIKSTDYILFDIKHMDSEQHQNCTGVRNEQVLKNLDYMLSCGIPNRIRYPMIPELNDSEDNIHKMCYWLSKRGVHDIDVLIFHDLYTGKYEQMMSDKAPQITAYTQDEITTRLDWMKKYGIEGIVV